MQKFSRFQCSEMQKPKSKRAPKLQELEHMRHQLRLRSDEAPHPVSSGAQGLGDASCYCSIQQVQVQRRLSNSHLSFRCPWPKRFVVWGLGLNG